MIKSILKKIMCLLKYHGWNYSPLFISRECVFCGEKQELGKNNNWVSIRPDEEDFHED